MTTTELRFPKLRALEVRPVARNGRRGFLLGDPLQLCENTVIIPQPLQLVLSLCDGTRENASALSASVAVRHGIRIPPATIDQLLAALNRAYLLDNDSYVQAQERALAEYRAAPHRPMTGAGQTYLADAEKLGRLLDRYLDQAQDDPQRAAVYRGEAGEASPSVSTSPIRGLISPHIDYVRGGPVYARVWWQAREAARQAGLALILGTDHAAGSHPTGGAGTMTLTRQHYATPYGVLPTAIDVVDRLADALGKEVAFAEELHHRTEHSIELAAVWLHHVRGGKPCDTVPVLCGSFRDCIEGGMDAAQDPVLRRLVDAFQQCTQGRRVLVIAAADLAHVGPAFGGRPLDMVGRARLQAADNALIDHVCAGDAEGFLSQIRSAGDRNNVCGVPPIYLALRLLQPTQGELTSYDRCPADRQGTSLVSICGVVFR
jgi:AmmeMemoRadiSam system protein B